MMNLNNDILLSIECPACLEYMKAPIYVCISGHSICNNCWKELHTCPSCSMDLSETRNYSLEALAELVYYPCNNTDFGCKEHLKLNELDEHSTVCSYRSYKCKHEHCDWKGRRTGIEDHYLLAHQQLVILGHEILCWWKDKEYDISLMLAHKELFYVHRKKVKDYMYWVVQYIGKSEDVIQYYYEIKIFSDQYQNRKVSISEICQDDTKDDITEIIDSGHAAGVPLSVLESYKNQNGRAWYNISIKKA